MNKKGQKLMLGIMMAFIAIIFIVQLINPYKTVTDDVRGVDKLNCSNTDISDGQLGTCILVDWSLFYWVGSALAVAVGFLYWKKTKE